MLNFYTTIFPIIFITIILFHIFNRFILIKTFENIINKRNNINSKQLNNVKHIYYSLSVIDHLLINTTIPLAFILSMYILNNYKTKMAFVTVISIIIIIIIILFIIYISILIRVYLLCFDYRNYNRYYNVINEFKFYKITINNIKSFIENKITNLMINKETKV